jgi:putative heme transporter
MARLVTGVTPAAAVGEEALGAMRPDPAEFALPSLDLRALARRAAVPAGLAAVAAIVIIGGGRLQELADALERALSADWRWVASAAGMELLSYAGYVALLWLVAGRATRRIDARRALEVTLGGAAATRLLPTAGVGGAALTLWSFRRAGIPKREAARTLLTFLVVLYAVFLGAIVVSGALIALGAVPATGPLTLSAVPAGVAATGIAAALVLGLRRRDAAGDAPEDAGRLRRTARLLGDATADAITLVRGADPRLLGALAWWLFDAAVLWAMLSAFGAAPPIAVVVLAYFVGQIGNALPIPGAVSGGIVGVLLAFGVQADLVLVSVLAYRSVAIWLPAPVGLLALTSLRRTFARWKFEDAPAARAA